MGRDKTDSRRILKFTYKKNTLNCVKILYFHATFYSVQFLESSPELNLLIYLKIISAAGGWQNIQCYLFLGHESRTKDLPIAYLISHASGVGVGSLNWLLHPFGPD